MKRPDVVLRCASRALSHGAYALGCIAFGDPKGAAKHCAAAAAWATVTTSVKAAQVAGVHPFVLDAIDAGLPWGMDYLGLGDGEDDDAN